MENLDDLVVTQETRNNVIKLFRASGKNQTAFWNEIKYKFPDYKKNPISKWLKNIPSRHIYSKEPTKLTLLIQSSNILSIPRSTKYQFLHLNRVRNEYKRT